MCHHCVIGDIDTWKGGLAPPQKKNASGNTWAKERTGKKEKRKCNCKPYFSSFLRSIAKLRCWQKGGGKRRVHSPSLPLQPSAFASLPPSSPSLFLLLLLLLSNTNLLLQREERRREGGFVRSLLATEERGGKRSVCVCSDGTGGGGAAVVV